MAERLRQTFTIYLHCKKLSSPLGDEENLQQAVAANLCMEEEEKSCCFHRQQVAALRARRDKCTCFELLRTCSVSTRCVRIMPKQLLRDEEILFVVVFHLQAVAKCTPGTPTRACRPSPPPMSAKPAEGGHLHWRLRFFFFQSNLLPDFFMHGSGNSKAGSVPLLRTHKSEDAARGLRISRFKHTFREREQRRPNLQTD